eukprot:CAMPEP_0113615554 /NCGR_PEP_ID=MMETSP0017_2-20120614/7763_1 /TAXON_ID=2856 /ORGANISM="Cylindrotheca closterium" /LENGTH=503 /DNA_ID=CAMNT_0000524799 /DNA_START=47 /DNA_END=1558 /DNA_ORIENTATION=+ /assembly_acc=CAM_ASM_000147
MDLSQPAPSMLSFLGCNEPEAVSSFGHRRYENHNESRTGMKPAEDLLSSELNKLSLQERSKALEDLHCVGEELEETPEMVVQSLEEFDHVVQAGNYPMYNLAASQNRAYVEESSLRLMFLRANLYDTHKAVRQMDNHLRQKAQYFGEDKIARDIRLDDLSTEDVQVLLSGFLHVQAESDRTGRLILCSFSHLMGRWNHPSCQWTMVNVIRAHYFIMFKILLPVPDVQMKGLATIFYDYKSKVSKASMPSLHDFMVLKAYRNTVPIRYTALHLCLKKEEKGVAFTNNLLEGILKGMTQYVKVRTRVHYGSDMESLYGLRSYGIPQESFPVDSYGKLRTEILNTWFLKHVKAEGREDDFHRRLVETMDHDTSDESMISSSVAERAAPAYNNNNNNNNNMAAAAAPVSPLQHDILLGRGVRLMQHPGNVRFREFLEGYQDDYDRAQRNKRRKVSIEVVRVLRHQGVRFLERNEHGDWVESDVTEAEDKVGQLFRSRRKLKKKNSNS